jgi:hypothetical protein
MRSGKQRSDASNANGVPLRLFAIRSPHDRED